MKIVSISIISIALLFTVGKGYSQPTDNELRKNPEVPRIQREATKLQASRLFYAPVPVSELKDKAPIAKNVPDGVRVLSKDAIQHSHSSQEVVYKSIKHH